MQEISKIQLPPQRIGAPFPYLKYSAKTGRFTLRDGTDITEGFTAIFDIPCIKIGWVIYDSPPFTEMVRINEPFPKRPHESFVRGIKMEMKVLEADHSQHMEILQSSKAYRSATGDILQQWLDRGCENDLPLVNLVETKEFQSDIGTIYRPVFRIDHWVDRAEFGKTPEEPKPGNDNDLLRKLFK